MILAQKVRIKPTPEQEQQLWRSAGAARWVYNWTIAQQKENYRHGGKFLSDGELRKQLTKLKQTEEYAWLNEISAQTTKQAVKDACDRFPMWTNTAIRAYRLTASTDTYLSASSRSKRSRNQAAK